MATMQVELSRVLVPGKSSSSVSAVESINCKLQKREYLLQTCLITAKWIRDFKQIWNTEQLKMFNIENSFTEAQ